MSLNTKKSLVKYLHSIKKYDLKKNILYICILLDYLWFHEIKICIVHNQFEVNICPRSMIPKHTHYA